MVNIRAIPDEVLQFIVKDFSLYELLELQKVCRSWYMPIHVLLLEFIELFAVQDVKRFVQSIDQNPNPSYLNAVKTIRLGSSFDFLDELDQETIQKLLLRFPNVKTLIIDDSSFTTRVLNDEKVCNALPRCCPKLESISLEYNEEDEIKYYNLIYKLRRSLTSLHLTANMTVPQCENVHEFVSSFPRLEHLVNVSGYLDNLEKCLPLIERLPYLHHITFGPGEDDEDFERRYFESKTQLETSRLIERFSKITSVSCANAHGPNFNSLKFIKQYFTGLEFFSLISTIGLLPLQRELVLDDILGLMTPLEQGAINLVAITPDIIKDHLIDVLQQVFYQIPTTEKKISRVLHITINDADSGPVFRAPAALEVVSHIKFHNILSREVKLSLSSRFNMDIIIEIFNLMNPLTDIYLFTLNTASLENCFSHSTFDCCLMFKSIIDKLPSVKCLVLDIPTIFIDNPIEEIDVTDVVLRASSGYTTGIIDRRAWKECIKMLPNLRRLQTFYSSGVWDAGLREFQVVLENCALEELTIDLTPAADKMYNINSDGFFVIEVDFFECGERCLYQVSFDFVVSSIIDDDLKGLKRNQDYMMVHIVVSSLKILDIFVYQWGCNEHTDYFDAWGSDEISSVNVFGYEQELSRVE